MNFILHNKNSKSDYLHEKYLNNLKIYIYLQKLYKI